MEQIRVIFKFWRRWQFLKIDLHFHLLYVWKSPYRLHKSYLKTTGASNLYTYGETPLTTMHAIAKKLRLSSQDIVYDLGSGSGKNCFWLAHFVGCRAYGIELNPYFHAKAEKIRRASGEKRVHFLKEDFFYSSLESATAIYFYGIAFDDAEVEKMMRQFETVQSGTKIITVSYPLESPLFKMKESFRAKYPWGYTELYINMKL